MGKDFTPLIDCDLAEIPVIGTDDLRDAYDYKDAASCCTNTERECHELEHHNA